MPIDVSGFVSPEENFGGLYKAADTVERNRREDERLTRDREGRQAATSKFMTDYLDPKDHLTGTNYDPQIVSGFQDVLQKAQSLAAKGANTNDILMAIGPSVSKLNQYSTTAKNINQRIKDQVGRLKPYGGYNLEALQSQALKTAFYGPDGKMKDISSVDPDMDWISETVKNNPELVTTGKGIDDFVSKTPMADYSKTVQTAYAGRTKNAKVEAKHPFWEGLQRDAKGGIAVDASGNPLGLDVEGGEMMDDKGKPIFNPETKQPFRAMDKNNFNVIMQHNPDIADYVRGQVNKHFKEAGAKELPAEGSPQWDMMARHILGDELKTRSRSTFRTIDQQKETAPAIKVELGRDPEALQAMAQYQSANKLKGDYAVYDPKTEKAVKTNAVEAIGKVFNNDPVFLGGDHTDIGGRGVIDVTDFLPGGGLKSGRADDDVYKGIYYDPNKRSLLVTKQARTKDKSGQKPTELEEVPESKIGLFVTRIAAANGIDPGKVSDMLDKMGYKNAKFNNVQSAGDTPQKLQQEHVAKIENALKDNKFEELKGVKTNDGVISEISERSKTSWIPGVDKYAVYVTAPDGKTKKAFTTSDKTALETYIKNGKTEETKSTNSAEDLRKKYNY